MEFHVITVTEIEDTQTKDKRCSKEFRDSFMESGVEIRMPKRLWGFSVVCYNKRYALYLHPYCYRAALREFSWQVCKENTLVGWGEEIQHISLCPQYAELESRACLAA